MIDALFAVISGMSMGQWLFWIAAAWLATSFAAAVFLGRRLRAWNQDEDVQW